MRHSYIIIDDDQDSLMKTQTAVSRFPNMELVATANNYDDALDAVLEYRPALLFLEIDPKNPASKLSLQFINELYRYLTLIPKVIITTHNANFAFDALRLEVFDYLLKPLQLTELRKSILKFEKQESGIGTPSPVLQEATLAFVELPVVVDEPEEILDNKDENPDEISPDLQGNITADSHEKGKPLIICVKSYGDYRFIDAKDICYLQADNNSTDIHLHNGEMITAFKTLKHFEGVLTSPFVRIHNSYIVNIDYVSRIHTGNAVCYIKNTTIKLPFSKSYKENVDSIINSITTGNYLEI